MTESSPKNQRQKLDVEGTEERQARLGALLSSISTPSPTSHQTSTSIPAPPSRPFAMPESSVLARVRDFLPMMASSNEALAAKKPEEVNMEDTEGDERVIAMDVNLGVFDVNGQPKGDLGPELDLPERGEADAMDEDDEEDDEEEDSEESSGSETSSEDETEDRTGVKAPA